VLTFIASGDSETASVSSNIFSKIGSLIGGGIGHSPAPAGWAHSPGLNPTAPVETPGNPTYINK